jgi:A/G-specific adenine glycosylase
VRARKRVPWACELLAWYDAEGRDLPWRRTRDPYAIWVSEIMCQQTQVATVIPYWERWMKRFPTIEALARADEQEVLASWQGLGYYRRARNLLEGARLLAGQGLPVGSDAWLKVPGVGRYTASAIASICLGESAAVVDGNVERVYSRVTADAACGKELHERCWKWAEVQVCPYRPGDWNQAMMELGATVCTPTRPQCHRCPISAGCAAYHSGRTHELPAKVKRPETTRLRQLVWVPLLDSPPGDALFGVRQIPPGEWWEGMWEFPRGSSPEELQRAVPGAWPESLGSIHHTVTRYRVSVDASLVRCAQRHPLLLWRSVEELGSAPMPAPQRRILKLALEYLGRV